MDEVRVVRHDGWRLVLVYRAALVTFLDWLLFRVLGLVRSSAWKSRQLSAFQRRSARRMAHTALRVRGLFIKVGQFVSTMTNFLPATFREELSALQDQVPPSPFEQIKTRLAGALPEPINEIFAEIEPMPIAAASLAQVHRATLHDGRVVAIKIQHPDIRRRAQRDLRTLKHLLLIGRIAGGLRGLSRIHDQLTTMIDEELDFERERTNLESIASHFNNDAQVAFPVPVPELCGPTILTTSFEVGIKINDRHALHKAGIATTDLARRLLELYCRMIFEHGLYHADPHPGNVLVREDGTIIFLDFGAVCRLSSDMREGIMQFVQALVQSDSDALHKAMMHMGFVAEDSSRDLTRQIVAYFQQRFFDQINLTSFRLDDIQADFQTKLDIIADFREMGITMRQVAGAFQVPREWVLLNRTLLILLGLCTELNPALNPMTVMRPHLQRFVLGKHADWGAFVTATIRQVLTAIIETIQDARRAVRQLAHPSPMTHHEANQPLRRTIRAATRCILFGIFTATSCLITYYAHTNGDMSIYRVALPVSVVGFFASVIQMLRLP